MDTQAVIANLTAMLPTIYSEEVVQQAVETPATCLYNNVTYSHRYNEEGGPVCLRCRPLRQPRAGAGAAARRARART